MTSSNLTSEDTKKKFVPKRRAPYLLQDAIIRKVMEQQNITKVVSKESDDHLRKNENPSYDSQLLVRTDLNYHEEVSKLYGIQKRIAHYLVNVCITRRDVTTGPVTAETLCEVANTTKKTLKKILQRMIEKKLIMRVYGKRGKGGFSIFSLEKYFIDVVRLQLDLENNHLSAVERYNNCQTPTTNSARPTLPQEWQDIDFNAIEKIGFGMPQIRQIFNKNVNTPDTIQDSIHHFAFVLENKPEKLKKYNDKLATFMSVLCKGGSWVDKDYMSPQELAFQKLAEQRTARVEKIKKMEEEFLESEFKIWEADLSDEEKDKIIPEDIKNAPFARDIRKELELKNYFKRYLWQEKMPEELKQIKRGLQS